MSELIIEQFMCRSDNFGVLVHDPETGLTAAIDAPEAEPILEVLAKRNWTLSHVFLTHHHADHTAGLPLLAERFNPKLIGPKKSMDKVDGIVLPVAEGNVIEWSGHDVKVLETPGHTLDHVSYWFSDDALVFAGDTLFALGCGRIFEGDAAMMWESLEKLSALPDATLLYCGHEYTLSNARFALSVDPDNAALKLRAEEVARLRRDELPTLPSSIGVERRTNPFLRASSQELKDTLGMSDASDEAVFTHLRLAKDNA
ncbi:MAG: hydroxyacylglutathione hydrolase [Hyphomicrobiales bacterium]